MGIYARYILPRLTDYACGSKPVTRQRQKVVPLAKGVVLEIGIGSGLNLPHYDAGKVDKVIGLEPDPANWKLSEPRRKDCLFPVEHVGLPAEMIPLEAASVDTVLVTYTLCTIPDPARALNQMRRVLKPGGQLIFCEHGEAPDEGPRKWQRRLQPVWNRIGGGCQLGRPIPSIINQGGWQIENLETMYIPGPRFASFNYWGFAVPSI
jgi:SAM-dependent methyltransferase